MRKLVRYSAAAAATVTGLSLSSVLTQLSKKQWDLRDRENLVTVAAGVLVTSLIWIATLP